MHFAKLNTKRFLINILFLNSLFLLGKFYHVGLLDQRAEAEESLRDRNIYANDFGAKCDGVHDDAAGIRAAVAYALTVGQATVHLAACRNDYLLLTADPGGLGAIVLGDGIRSDAVNIVGDAYAVDLADKIYRGRVRMYLGNSMSVPAIYFRRNAAITWVQNVEIDGNGSHQKLTNIRECGHRLYIICVEDDLDPKRESGLSLFNVKLVGALSGAYYLGSGRGAVYLQNIWALGGGATDIDALIMLQGYDTIIENPQISNSKGFGIYFGEGTQYQITNGALWDNNVGIGVGNTVNQLSVLGTQIGDSVIDGIRTAGPTGKGNSGTRSFVSVSFKSNGKGASETTSDVRVADGGKVTLIAPDFGGGAASGPKPTYNALCSGESGHCRIQIVGANYAPGDSSTNGLTNDIKSLITILNGDTTADTITARDTIEAQKGFIAHSHLGVSCERPPSAFFTVTDGIVTRC